MYFTMFTIVVSAALGFFTPASAIAYPLVLSQLASRDIIDPTKPGTMVILPDFTVLIGDKCGPALGNCEPDATINTSSSGTLKATNDLQTCQYKSVASQPAATISGISFNGTMGFANWSTTVSAFVVADHYSSDKPLTSFLFGASGVLSIFGGIRNNCGSSYSPNSWPDNVESDGTFLYLAPRRSSVNGPGLISWGTTPDNSVLGNDNYNLTKIVAKTKISTSNAAAMAESCAFTILAESLVTSSGDKFVSSDPANYILATMLNSNVMVVEGAIRTAQAFELLGWFNTIEKLIRVSCDAVPPTVSVAIGCVNLEINPADMIVRGEDGCYSAWQQQQEVDGKMEVLKLGQPFLKNVGMRVGWDLGIEFTSRPYYAE